MVIISNNLPSNIVSQNEIISCTIDIPKLCIYAIPSEPGFQLFYDDQKFDFLNDEDWTQIIVTNNYDNIDIIEDQDDHDHDHNNHEIEKKQTTEPGSKKPILAATRRRLKRRRSCKTKCRLRRVFDRLRGKESRMRREQKLRRAVYKKLYRFGKKLGRAMRTKNFWPICGLTGMCKPHGGCGHMRRARCPRRFATYLGPPHIVGSPSYIMGTPPVNTAPHGWGSSGSFPMGLVHPQCIQV